MKIVLQRVKKASVLIENKQYSSIKEGFLVLVAFTQNDNEKLFDYFARRLLNLRLFDDESGRMNLSLKDIKGELLIVSQFTLYGKAKKGKQVSWSDALSSEEAKKLYDKFVEYLQRQYFIDKIKTGVFGADMQIELVNNGPVTLILEKNNKF